MNQNDIPSTGEVLAFFAIVGLICYFSCSPKGCEQAEQDRQAYWRERQAEKEDGERKKVLNVLESTGQPIAPDGRLTPEQADALAKMRAEESLRGYKTCNLLLNPLLCNIF